MADFDINQVGTSLVIILLSDSFIRRRHSLTYIVKEFAIFYETRRFIVIPARAWHLLVSAVRNRNVCTS
jgi:hypothetical protein